jgi:hypothetical protein
MRCEVCKLVFKLYGFYSRGTLTHIFKNEVSELLLSSISIITVNDSYSVINMKSVTSSLPKMFMHSSKVSHVIFP